MRSEPSFEILQGLGLTSVNGKVLLDGGGWIEAGWAIGTNESVTSNIDVMEAAGVIVNVKVPSRV
jgi:hypothetical protein